MVSNRGRMSAGRKKQMKDGVEMGNRILDRNKQSAPLARKDGLVIKKLDEEVLIYDTQRHKAHCLNHMASLVWEHCDGTRTVKDLSNLIDTSNTGKETDDQDIKRMIWTALDQLEKSHLLETPVVRPAGLRSLSRRQAVMAGIATLAVPIVSTIIAPTAARASTCTASGGSCSISAECCSGLCSTGVCA